MFKRSHFLQFFSIAVTTVVAGSPSYAASESTNTAHSNEATQSAICVDSDGDGWGWTGTESCKVDSQKMSIQPPATKVHQDCLDTNGDGWGWYNGERCQTSVITNEPSTQILATKENVISNSACIDTDGDGWGWDGEKSCRLINTTQDNQTTVTTTSPINKSGSTTPENCDKLNSGNYHITELVTDVFLTAGQSNATGGETEYKPEQYAEDRTNSRIIVWTENNRWEVADPKSQTWHNGKYPGGHGRYQNHPAFQIARGIADNDSCRVVAFITTAASGMPINHWLNDIDDHYSSILHKVPSALNALPGKYKIDMIWWMQGEADDDEIVDRYFYKLSELIYRFRSQNWFDNNGLFLANETRQHYYANDAIRKLATDSDPYTDYSRGENTVDMQFPSIKTAGVHFNAHSLRRIGDLVAEKYLYEYLPGVNR